MDEERLLTTERNLGLLGLLAVALMAAADIWEGYFEGASALHIGTEVMLLALYLGAAVYLWTRIGSVLSRRVSALRDVADVAKNDLAHFKEANLSLTAGITKAVEHQLDSWGLSDAERDVAFLLIKGLSLKEISTARQTSEHTVRQQAATIYKKSGLGGRAQLSAFFLEDLFTPTVNAAS